MRTAQAVLVVLAAVAAAEAFDPFALKYSYKKAIGDCLGEEIYHGWLKKVKTMTSQCYREAPTTTGWRKAPATASPITNPLQERGVTTEPLYDSVMVQHLMEKAKARVTNFTCVMQRMDYMYDDFSINFDYLKQETLGFPVPQALKDDLVYILDYCRDFMTCMPTKKSDKSLPENISRALNFIQCERKMRLKICMKNDLLKNLDKFDLSSLPLEGYDEEQIAEKLLHVLWGIDNKHAFQLF